MRHGPGNEDGSESASQAEAAHLQTTCEAAFAHRGPGGDDAGYVRGDRRFAHAGDKAHQTESSENTDARNGWQARHEAHRTSADGKAQQRCGQSAPRTEPVADV